MLPTINRLTKKNDFDAVFQNGKGIRKDFLAFRLMKNAMAQSRFGFIVSKKVSVKAVERNRIKRRLRSIAANHLGKIKIPIDIIIIALPTAKRKTFADTEKVVGEVLKPFV